MCGLGPEDRYVIWAPISRTTVTACSVERRGHILEYIKVRYYSTQTIVIFKLVLLDNSIFFLYSFMLMVAHALFSHSKSNDPTNTTHCLECSSPGSLYDHTSQNTGLTHYPDVNPN